MNGWQCPQCGKCYAPWVAECGQCNGVVVTLTGGGCLHIPPWETRTGGEYCQHCGQRMSAGLPGTSITSQAQPGP